MDTTLPAPIAAYVEANTRLDADGMLAAFAPDAVVQDEGRRLQGHEKVMGWIQSATIASRAVFTPDAWHEQDGRIVVTGLTRGDFPGSPIRFSFRFALDGVAITALAIA